MGTSFFFTLSIAGLIGLLLLIAFIAQTIQRRREQQKRIIAALKSRIRKLNELRDICPIGFLSSNFLSLIINDIIDAYRQLQTLDNTSRIYPTAIRELGTQLQEITQSQKQRLRLNDIQQVNVLEQHLKALQRYLQTLLQNNKLDLNKAKPFLNELKDRKLFLTYSLNDINGNLELAKGRNNYALLYFEKALKIYKVHPAVEEDSVKIQKQQEEVKALRKQVAAEKQKAAEKQAEENTANDDDTDSSWKKKKMYD